MSDTNKYAALAAAIVGAQTDAAIATSRVLCNQPREFFDDELEDDPAQDEEPGYSDFYGHQLFSHQLRGNK